MNSSETTLLLINLSHRRAKDPVTPPGHASLAASARSHGRFRVVELMLDGALAGEHNARVVRAETHRHGTPAWVGIGAYVFNERSVRNLVSGLRASGVGNPVVVGGPSVSFTGPGELEALFPGVDYFIRGYAENALTALVGSAGQVIPLGVHRAGTPDQHHVAEVDMTTLASPFLDPKRMPIGSDGFIWWETKRSCPFRCAFCQHFQAGPTSRGLQIPLQRLHREVKAFAEHGVRDVKIIDPCFNTPGTHYLDVLRLLARWATLDRLVMEARFECVDEPFASLVAQLNGELEFGLQTVVREEEVAIRRVNDRKKVEAAAALLHRHGTQFTISLIYGLPHQTPASFQKTIDYARSLGPKDIVAFPLGLYRGSALERHKERWAFEVEEGELPLVVASNSFTWEDYQQMAAMAAGLQEYGHAANRRAV